MGIRSRRRLWRSMSIAFASVCGLLVLAWDGSGDSSSATPASSRLGVKKTARTAFSPPAREAAIEFRAEPPRLTEAQIGQIRRGIERSHRPGPALPSVVEPAEPDGAETMVHLEPKGPLGVTINKNVVLTAPPTDYRSVVDEPSVANNGNYVFYTGNWYAARSTTGGNSFAFANPYSDMSSFCCDQDTIYDAKKRIFLWYRQGIDDDSGVNYFRLGVSNNNGATWFFYNFYPTDTDETWTNEWYDYPQIALSNSYLYLCTNMFDSSDTFVRTVIFRFPLSALANHTGFNYQYIADEDHFTYTPVQGATTMIYWAAHETTSQLTVYSWAENSNEYNEYTRTIPAWKYELSGTCRGPDGKNWCGRSDSRLLTGWVAGGVVGFMWNADRSKGFTYPYVNAATFRTSDLSYLARPNLYNKTYAFQYAGVAPNANGKVGISVAYGGGKLHPSHAVGIAVDGSSGPTSWQLVSTRSGNKGPIENEWGDYLRVRPYRSSNKTWWIATGYSLQGGGTGSYIQPQFVIFSPSS